MTYKTKRDLTFARPYSALPKSVADVFVEAGAPVVKEDGVYWIAPKYFRPCSVVKHDAETHGFRVNEEDVEEVSE